MHINIRGLRRNIEELIFTLEEKKVDVASIKKTFLKSKHKVTIPGYKMVWKDCSTDQGGGVTIKMNTKNLKKLIICSYYSPKGIVYEQLFEKLENKSNNNGGL